MRRCPLRKVCCCVAVTVYRKTALASIRSIGERKIKLYKTAARTPLARRVPPVRHDNPSVAPLQFVRQLPGEFGPPGLAN
jgi:hypothetical protein